MAIGKVYTAYNFKGKFNNTTSDILCKKTDYLYLVYKFIQLTNLYYDIHSVMSLALRSTLLTCDEKPAKADPLAAEN